MTMPFKIEPDSFYSESAVRNATGITGSALTRARKAGLLRCTRQAGRVLYKGEWLLAWLTSEPAATTPAAAEPAQQPGRRRKVVTLA